MPYEISYRTGAVRSLTVFSQEVRDTVMAHLESVLDDPYNKTNGIPEGDRHKLGEDLRGLLTQTPSGQPLLTLLLIRDYKEVLVLSIGPTELKAAP